MKVRSRLVVGGAQATKCSTEFQILSAARWGACALATVGVLALAEPPWGFSPLAGVALAPWLVWLARRSAWLALLGSAGVGIAFGCVSALWAPAALRSLGATPTESVAGFLVGALWVKGIPFAVVGILVYAARQQSTWVRVAAAGG